MLLTIVRWFWLLRAHDLPLSMGDALRLGFLGYLLNFVSFGAVGGDLFKAIFAARKCHARRAEAVATVIIDRLIGLYIIFVMATVAMLATGVWRAADDQPLRLLCRATFICTGVGTLAIMLLMMPDLDGGKILRLLAGLPKIGPTCERLINAMLHLSRAQARDGCVAGHYAGRPKPVCAGLFSRGGRTAERASVAAVAFRDRAADDHCRRGAAAGQRSWGPSNCWSIISTNM